jgi:hypothetical protein
MLSINRVPGASDSKLRGTTMDRLIEIGFQHVGHWHLQNNALALEINRLGAQRNVLYAFVMEHAVLYVGKTANTLEARMGGYLRPHSTQRTNVRNKQALVQLLQNDNLVEIYAWADSGLHKIGRFHLNYAAGLEDSIIQTISPPWNGARSNLTVPSNPLPVPNTLFSSDLAATALAVETDSVESNDDSVSIAEVHTLEETGLINFSPTFQITLGSTYFNKGFFNVPVKYSGLFPDHGSVISIYCGGARTFVRAVVDRNANQSSRTPRIYGKSQLASWFGQTHKLNDEVMVRVISQNEIELR